MKKLYKKNAGKLTAYSAMAGAFVALSTDANATVVYTDITDVDMVLGDGLPIDLDDNGVIDFLIIDQSNTGGNWTWVQMYGYTASGYGNDNNKALGYFGGILSYASALGSGDAINSDGSFIANVGGNEAVLVSVYSGVNYGQFIGANDKYVGVQFDIDGDIHYGWIRVDCDVTPTTATIKDWAYEDAVEATIDAGQKDGGIIAIITLNESQVSAYSFGNIINLVVKDLTAGVNSVNVFDIDGKVVYSNTLTSNNMSINLDNAATGLYTVQLLGTDNAVYTKN